MRTQARAVVLILAIGSLTPTSSAYLIQQDSRNNDLVAGVTDGQTARNANLNAEMRDFVNHDVRTLKIRNRDKKFYEDEVNYFKSLMGVSVTRDQQKRAVNRKGYPKSHNREERVEERHRIRRQADAPNFPHLVTPRSAGYSTGFVNLQPGGPFIHHAAVHVPDFPYHPAPPFLAPLPPPNHPPLPPPNHPQSFPYPSPAGHGLPAPAEHAAYQRSVLPDSREVNFQLLKTVNGGDGIDRDTRTFGSARNSPTLYGRADTNLLGERFQTIDGSLPFGGGLKPSNPILDNINQNLDRSRIQMLEQQIRIRDERLRNLEQELLSGCNRRPDVFGVGRQNLGSNFGEFPRRPNIGAMPFRELPNFGQPQVELPNLAQTLSDVQNRFQPRAREHEDDEIRVRPQSAAMNEGTELEQIQKAKEFDFNKQPAGSDFTQSRGNNARPQKARPESMRSNSDIPENTKRINAASSNETPTVKQIPQGDPDNAAQAKSAGEIREPSIPQAVSHDNNDDDGSMGQFVDGQWLPSGKQQLRKKEKIPFCIPAPAADSGLRSNDVPESPATAQDLDRDQQKIILDTLEQAVKPLMKSIDAIKENGLDAEEAVVTRPIPNLKELLASRAPLPLPRMPAFRSNQRSDDDASAAILRNEPETPKILPNLKSLVDDPGRPLSNIFQSKAPGSEPRPLMDALEKMRSNRKEILQDLAGNLKPLERPGLLGLNRPPILGEILSPAEESAVESQIPPLENIEEPQKPDGVFGRNPNRKKVDQPKSNLRKKPIVVETPIIPQENTEEEASPVSSRKDESEIVSDEPEMLPVENDSPRTDAEEDTPKKKTKPGKEASMVGLDAPRETIPDSGKKNGREEIDESETNSPRENEEDPDENMIEDDLEAASPMPRNNAADLESATEATVQTSEPSICQKIIKDIVASEMQTHAEQDTNPAMFINKNFTAELMKKVRAEIAQYQQEHAGDGTDIPGSCEVTDMKLEIVSQVLTRLNDYIQEVPATSNGGVNQLTPGQIDDLKSLLES